jgi:hypothetical protein
MGTIMGSKAQTFTMQLVGKGKAGTLGSVIVRGEPVK